MESRRALLLIADIGGYTEYMQFHRTLLGHAEAAARRLLEMVVEATPNSTGSRWKAVLEGIGPVRTDFLEVQDLAGPLAPVPDPSWLRRSGETVAILGRGLRYRL